MIATDERQCSLFALLDAPPPAAPLPPSRSCHYHAGLKAKQEAQERKLPSYFTKDNTPNARDWLEGWDAGEAPAPPPSDGPNNFASIKAQEVAKRALEIALAGGHSIALIGPAGVGKTMLAAAARAIRQIPVEETRQVPVAWPDMAVTLEPLSEIDNRSPPPAETSAAIAARVHAAIAFRQGVQTDLTDEPARRLMDDACKALHVDDGQRQRLFEVARTIAALANWTTVGRIHVAEALSYFCRIEPPEPEPEPEPSIERALKSWRGDFEVVEVDPKRLEWDSGDIRESYSADTLMSGKVRTPFRFRGGMWVNTGGCHRSNGPSQFECYRIVPVEAFDGPRAAYNAHDFGHDLRATMGGYHGMTAKQGSREIVLQGPPVVFTEGQPEQAAML